MLVCINLYDIQDVLVASLLNSATTTPVLPYVYN